MRQSVREKTERTKESWPAHTLTNHKTGYQQKGRIGIAEKTLMYFQSREGAAKTDKSAKATTTCYSRTQMD